MANFYLVEILDTSKDLMEKSTGLAILQPALLDDVFEKFTSTCVFHYQKELF